jgi:DNA-binding NarL/FixJ family response regulator
MMSSAGTAAAEASGTSGSAWFGRGGAGEEVARSGGLGDPGRPGVDDRRPYPDGRWEPSKTTMPIAGSTRFETKGQGADGQQQPLRGARILIVDDYTVYREYLAHVITAHGATLAGRAWDRRSMSTALAEAMPHVVLINMATKDSAALLAQALAIGPDTRTIVIGVSDDDESEIVEYAEAGVAGYHMRTDSLDNLLYLINRVVLGDTAFSPKVSAMLLRRLSLLASERTPIQAGPGLTTREAEILTLIEMGLSNREIAQRLSIAIHTVKNHVHSLLTKLGVGSRAQAAALSRSSRLGDELPPIRLRSAF